LEHRSINLKRSELRNIIRKEIKEARQSVGDKASDFLRYSRQYKKDDNAKLNQAIPLLQQVVRRKKAEQIITTAEAKELENLILDIEKRLS